MRNRHSLSCFTALILLLGIALAPPAASAAEPQAIVCIQCHSKMPERYSQPVTLWQGSGSIHKENGIACNDCHGGDPKDAANAMSPARGFLGAPKGAAIPPFCGRCHVGVLKEYAASLHGKALGRGGPTCVTCHGNHLVLKASLELINEKSCSRCHTFEQARTIRASMQETEKMITAIEARLADYKKLGSDTEKLDKELFAVRNRFHSLFHTVDVRRVGRESAGIQADLGRIVTALNGMDREQQQRKITGAVIVSAMLLFAMMVHLIRKTYEQGE